MFKNYKAIKILLILNIIVFIITSVTYIIGYPFIHFLASYPINSDFFLPTQIITHLFVHGNFQHLFFNMFALIAFGPICENHLGYKKFLIYYILMGVGAFIIYYMFNTKPMIGASGSIYGVMIFYTMLYPNDKVIGILKMKYFTFFILFSEIISCFLPYDNIGHIAHIGGAIFGYLLFKIDSRSTKVVEN